VRNRAAILSAATRLFATSAYGPGVSLDEIAEAAGVGKGTLFRAFGGRAGLVQAVFEARTAAFREAVTSGPAPLGPAGEPRERLQAIMAEILRAKLANRQLSLALEDTAAQRNAEPLYQTAPYQWVHGVIVEILGEIADGERPQDDHRWLAHVLLAIVRADLIEHLVTTSADEGELLRNVRDTVERLLGPVA
jgi:AcrR family transcriptional regulator